MALEIKGLQRVFKIRKGSSEIELADPDNSLSPNEVMDFYSMTYPELTTASVHGPESQMAGLAVLIIRAADLSYIGRGTMGREKRRLPPPGDVTLF